MTPTTQAGATSADDGSPKITREELIELFGDYLPIEAVPLITEPFPYPTRTETRHALREMATAFRARPAATLSPAAYAFAVETWGRAWVENEAGDLHAFAALASPAVVPESVRRLLKRLAAASRSLAEFPPDGLVKGDLYVAAKNEGQGTGWRYLPLGVTVSDLDDAARLATAPAPLASAGDVEEPLCFDAQRYNQGECCGGFCVPASLDSGDIKPAAPEPAEGGEGWQPISTAPANQAVQVYVPGLDYCGNDGVYAGMLVDMGTGPRWMTFAWAMGRDMEGENAPTHWRPLPEAPSTPTRADAGAEGRR